MDKNKIFIIIAILIGVITDIAGVILNDILLIILGPLLAILFFMLPFLVIGGVKKQKLFIPEEDKYETILTLKKKHHKKKKNLISMFMGLVLAIIVFYILWFFISYLYRPSSLAMENVINAGCRELNEGTGRCIKDPATIIVKYDVNGDEIVGGVNDTLAALLGQNNCTGNCIKARCNCILL